MRTPAITAVASLGATLAALSYAIPARALGPVDQSISNGLGATTVLTYVTTATLGAIAESEGISWPEPENTHVVVNATTTLAGNAYAGGPYSSSYAYGDPVYDKRFREFRGFRFVRTTQDDASNPLDTQVTDTTYLTAVSPPATTPDVPWDVLVGLPERSTVYSGNPQTLGPLTGAAPGPALSTTHWTYRVNALATGVDKRVIRDVYAETTDVWHYASSSIDSGDAGPHVTLTDVNDFEPAGSPVTLTQQSTFALLGGSTDTLTTSSVTMDSSGNVTRTIDGGISGMDVPIEHNLRWTNVGNDWNWRVDRSSIGYTSGTGGARTFTYTYDAYGNQKSTSAVLSATGSLWRVTSAPPVSAASDGTYVVSTSTYDPYGNLSTVQGADSFGYTKFVYDVPFQQLLITKSVYPVSPTGTALTAKWTMYDRGLEVPTESVAVDGAVTSTTYEPFGRPSSISLPNPSNPTQADAAPDLSFQYLDIQDGPFQVVIATQSLDSVGDMRQVVAFTDAWGRPVVSAATGGAEDGSGAWICTGLTQRDSRGRVLQAYAPYSTTSAPGVVPPLGPNMTWRIFTHDAFGGVVDALDLDGTLMAHYERGNLFYNAFDYNAWAAQNNGGLPTYSTVKFDGHGRVMESDERTANGGGATGIGFDLIATTTAYQATGEPLTITRSSLMGMTYSRSMVYDSLGHLVSNVEPNTSERKHSEASQSPLIGWRYAYDINGQLVGTSDARGCGVNFTYDKLGRELTEDYVPCEPSTQAPYTVAGAGGEGTEVYNVYDEPEFGESAQNVGSVPQALVGRLSASYSRGEHTNYAYDGRGRLAQVSRQMPTPSAETTTGALAGRYAPWWYRAQSSYDNANRRVAQTTGADVPELMGASIGGLDAAVTTTYDARDIPVQVGGSYGAIVRSEQRYPDGRLHTRSYADVAGTTGVYGYDGRNNLNAATVQRAASPVWSTPSSGGTYPLPATSCATSNCTTPTVLQNTTSSYDLVNNPFVVNDQRFAQEWPENEGPVTGTIIGYDDRYRVRSVNYGYTGGGTELQAANFLPQDPPPISFEMPATRSALQTYAYDWQGNVVTSTDSTNSLLQRSSGSAQYGVDGESPNRVAAGSDSTGSYTTKYDAAGNLTTITATVPASSTDTLLLTLTYDWDEAGHLRTAQRAEEVWDFGTETCGPIGCFHSEPREVSSSTIDNAYLYDGGGTRTWHSSNNTILRVKGEFPSDAYTLEVFPSLRVNDTPWTGSEYVRSATNEAPYIVAGGGSYGRVIYDPTLPSVAGNPLHVYIQIPDGQGSTSTTIDRDSGELVEQITYLSDGQTETDYRPERWHGFREDYRYTGKNDDYDVGLVYFGARYYSPGLNRWVSADPLTIHGLGGDINPYSFVRGSPFRFTDPMGFDDSVGPPTMMRVPEVVIVADPRAKKPSESEQAEVAGNAIRNDAIELALTAAHGADPISLAASVLHGHTTNNDILEGLAAGLRAPGPPQGEGLHDADLRQMYSSAQTGFNIVTAVASLELPQVLEGWFESGASRVAADGLAGERMAIIRQLGEEGEVAANILKNTERIPSATGTAAYRIPDVLDHAAQVIGDVKNVGKLSYTNQLRDFAAYAQTNGYQFELTVRATTRLTGPLSIEVANGNIVLRFLP